MNFLICIFLILVLFSGLFFESLLGFLFITTFILLLLSLLNACKSIIFNNYKWSVFIDVAFKLIYFSLTALLYSLKQIDTKFRLLLVLFIILLLIDVIFLHINYNLIYSRNKKESDKTIKFINLMHSYYKLGDRNALFGEEQNQKFIRCLSWLPFAYILTIIITILCSFCGNLYFTAIKSQSKLIFLFAVLFMSILYSYIYNKSLTQLPMKRILKFFIGITPFFSMNLMFISNLIPAFYNIDLFIKAIGFILVCCLLYMLNLASQYYSKMISINISTDLRKES